MSQKVPISFVERAKKHLDEEGEPFLEYRLDEYEETLYVDAERNITTFTASGFEEPPQTWGEYMEYQRWNTETMQEWAIEYGVLPKDFAEDEEYEDWLNWEIGDPYKYFPNWESNSHGDPYEVLKNAGIGKDVTAVDENGKPVDSGIEVGSLFSVWGHPATGSTSLVASSMLAVSCLQYLLDEKRTGVMIEYVPMPWG